MSKVVKPVSTESDFADAFAKVSNEKEIVLMCKRHQKTYCPCYGCYTKTLTREGYSLELLEGLFGVLLKCRELNLGATLCLVSTITGEGIYISNVSSTGSNLGFGNLHCDLTTVTNMTFIRKTYETYMAKSSTGSFGSAWKWKDDWSNSKWSSGCNKWNQSQGWENPRRCMYWESGGYIWIAWSSCILEVQKSD